MKEKLVYPAIVAILLLCFFSSCKRNESNILLEKDEGVTELKEEFENSGERSTPDSVSDTNKVFVHVCGAVKKPGVYELKVKSRVIDAIHMAGGLKKTAKEDYINLAEIVEDQQKIYVPTLKEVTEDNLESANLNAKKININRASKEELKTLSGIGDAKANAIIEYREKNGKYKKIDDIMKIPGIKDAMFNKIKDSISVE